MRFPGRTLHLFENGRRLGTLTRTPSGLALQYAPDWLAWEGATPVSLSLPLDPAGHRGERVFRFLDNLLPDSGGMRARLAARVDAPDTHPYTLLAYLGRCSAGALTFVPEGEDPGLPGAVRGTPISDAEVARLVAELDRRPLGVGPRLRISLAGAQRKTALLFSDGVWQLPHGFTPTTHILKPQIGSLMGVDFSRSVENEFLCLSLASAFGLEVAPARIEDFGEARVLVVERFDRRWTDDGRLLRVPHEDLAQALGVAAGRKYEMDGGPGMIRLLGLLEGSVASEKDRRSFLRAQIVFWLLAAIDGHAKNYSLRLLPGSRFRLAPLYDIVSVQPALTGGELPADEASGVACGRRRRFAGGGSHRAAAFRRDRESRRRSRASPAKPLSELIETRARAFEAVREGLPDDFPHTMEVAIFDAITARLLDRRPLSGGISRPLGSGSSSAFRPRSAGDAGRRPAGSDSLSDKACRSACRAPCGRSAEGPSPATPGWRGGRSRWQRPR